MWTKLFHEKNHFAHLQIKMLSAQPFYGGQRALDKNVKVVKWSKIK